ncbi:TRAP transporter substrate-binding protein [Pelagibius marinus]|uniref:TRAP transporter substrate-binding protein n=1 Tax=Pelagibius marinus TaxID=2762760 RepID=UPI0018733261|nr:TRAP transporter substrate-binding protein [Pelagibius marinus]
MKRRQFISKAGLGVVGATATLAAPAIASGKKQWIAVSAFGKAGLLGQALEEFTAQVAAASNGRLSIKAYHAGELVKPFEAIDAVQSGTAQMGFGAPYYWAGKSDSISFVAAMPYGLTAQEQNAWCYYGGGIEIADKTAYNPLGLKFLPLGNTGNQMGGWYAKEIHTVADLDGLKFRMPGLGGEILKTFGVNVILLPGSEVLPALTSGAIDGTEWIGPAADMGKGLFKVVNNYYYPGWHEPATILDGFFDLNEWEGLDADLKAIVTEATVATNLKILSKFQAVNNVALQKLVKEHGVNIRRYSDELVQAIGARATELLPELAARTPEGKELFNHIVDFRKGMLDWSGYSEQAFLAARGAASFKSA